MERVGFIGIGNMGLRMSKNILNAGYDLTAYDVREEALTELADLKAHIAKSPREVGEASDIVFIMVLNGLQAREVVCGNRGLLTGMKPGSTIFCTSTIMRSEIIEIASAVDDRGIYFVDSPVSGGVPGATAGTLTLMAATNKDVLDQCMHILKVVGQNIYHVGEEIGMGQTVKAALSVLTGVTYAGIFEALILGVKAGVKPEILHQVISTSVVGSFLFRDTTENIMDRNFTGQSHIGTMDKDLGIAKSMAKDYGVPLFTTSVAHELFQAGKTVNPDEDNWTIIKVLEEIVGVEVKKTTS